ncbi:MAG: purine-nucleoside phosphorylase [Proteobacteria bacterium]|nr:purine-nucleoside phosphorylase [Pseudomonadota bacterium]
MPIHVRSQRIAPIVLLPGDPDRALWIARNFLQNVELTNEYRKMFGLNGMFEGMPVTVQTTGMGGPSAAIVCEELIQLGAQFLIRVGTCGAADPALEPGDLLLVHAACMSDGTSKEIVNAHMSGTGLDLGFPATSDFEFLCAASEEAKRLELTHHIGKVASLDRFYGHPLETYQKLAKLGIRAVEMEAATVLCTAATHNIRAAALLTVSDQLNGQKRAPEHVIARGVHNMTLVALHAAKRQFTP